MDTKIWLLFGLPHLAIRVWLILMLLIILGRIGPWAW